MVTPTTHMTVSDFDEWVNQPEQTTGLYELIGGRDF